MINIKKVETKKDWKEFVNLPFYLIYKENKNWVPPLKKDILFKLDDKQHPFWEHAKCEVFIAEKDSQVAGRIAAIIDNNYNKLWNEKMGAFGFFEVINNYEVASTLFDTAYNWLKNNGMNNMRGPLSPSQNGECGFLLDAYDSPPVLMMPYNPPYYIELAERYGFKKAKDLLAFYKANDDKPSRQIEITVKRLLQNPNISTRCLNMKNIEEESGLIKKLYNECWIKNWGFSPMTDKEFDLMVKELKTIADPNLIWFAYYKGNPAGIAITLPDFNYIIKKLNGKIGITGMLKFLYYKKKVKGTRALVFGFKKEYRRLGLPALLYYKTEQAGIKRGYKWCELSWNLEDNDLINQFDTKVGGHIYKKYRLYEKKIK